MSSAAEGVFVAAGNTPNNHGAYAQAVELLDGRVLLMGGRILGPNHMLSAVDIYDPTTGLFTTTGGLNHGRSAFAAVPLVDGRILVMGGETGSQFGQALASAEIYDPAAGTFAFVPGMSVARYQPSAARLADGRVLVTGGADNGQHVQSSADLYEADASSVAGVSGGMNHPRVGHSATLLDDGTVLLAGGAPSLNSAQSSAEIFDPLTGSFTLIDSMSGPRSYHTTTRLNDGRVLLTGGYDGSGSVKTAEVFDPSTRTFSAVGDMAEARYSHTASRLPDGRVLVVGGFTLLGTASARAEVFDPASLSFEPAGNLNSARWGQMAAILPDGDVLIAGGYNSCLGNLASAERFEVALQSPGSFVPAEHTPANHGIYARSAELTDGRVLIVGGRILGPNNMVAAASIFDPVTGNFSNTGSMTEPRSAHTATTLSNGKVLVTGGETAPVAGAITASAELYDPVTGSFEGVGGMSVARYFHAATRLTDGRVLVVGGVNNSTGNGTAEIYDPVLNSFQPPVPMTSARAGATATTLLDGRVLVVGGALGGNGATAEIYDPATASFIVTGGMDAPRATHTATLLTDGRVLVAGGYDGANFLSSAEIYDPATGQFSVVGSMMEARYFHVAMPLSGNRVLITGGFNNAYAGLSLAEVYDPGTQSFTPAGQMNQGRWSPVTANLGGGRFLIAAGYDSCAGNLTSAEIFEAASSTIDPTLTWPSPAPISHGAPLTGLQLNATATAHGTNVNGTFTYTPAAGTILNAGANQTLSVTFAPADAAHFNAVSATVHIDVIDITAECAPDSTFSAVGDTLYNHGAGAMAARLPDGRVIVAGGVLANYSVTAGVSLYDPTTRLFSNAGSMNHARNAHTATELAGGRVLMTGGQEASGAGHVVAAAELYDPVSGAFISNGGMNAARFWHSAVCLNDGRVWVGGGYNNGFNQASAEIYDPATDAFTLLAASMTSARAEFTATRLNDGRVLIVGGFNDYSVTVTATAEIFNPTSGTFEATGSLHAPRATHAAVLLPDGNVLIVGGRNASYTPVPTAEIYDPGTGSFTVVGEMSKGRSHLTATLLPGGCVLVAGGADAVETGLASAEIYAPATRSFGPLIPMQQPRYAHTATLLQDGSVLLAAGRNGVSGDLTSAEVFGPPFSVAIDPVLAWPSPTPISYGTALSGLQLNATATAHGTNVNGTFTYTPAAGTILNAGANQTLSVTFAPADAAHFNAVSATVLIDVIDDVPPGLLMAWGENIYGEIGPAGDAIVEPTPVGHPGLSGVSAVAAGNKFTLVLKADGTVWSWGYNANGQLGDGTTASRNNALLVSGLSSVVAIDAGGYTSLALKSDGTVWAWGYGGYGQLGNGTAQDSGVPVQVQDLDQVVAIGVGRLHCVALRADGTVWRWGAQYGENGGTEVLPIQVAGVTGVVGISAGENVTLAVRADGMVWAWGNDSYGQNGNGPGYNPGPEIVQGLANITAVSCGGGHVLALQADGTVWAWGYNAGGALGDGTTVDRDTPVQVQGIGSVAKIAAGGYHNLALKSDGTLWAWGYGHVGQLGIGHLAPMPVAPTPVLLPAGMNVIAADFLHSVALQATVASPPLIISQPASLTVCSGAPASFAVSVSGTVSAYQWRKNGVDLANGGPVAGAHSATLTLGAVSAGDAGSYDVVVTYAEGTVNSAAATLDVQQPPQILTGPAGATRIEGESITFTVSAIGTGTLTYQWRKNGTAILGETGASLILNSLAAGDAGSYDVVVSGFCAPNAISTPAILTVVPPVNTPAGENVVVAPVDPATGTSPVSVTFSETTQPGQTTVTSSQTGPPTPDGFKVGKIFYDVSTTATFTGPIQLCFSYAGQNVGNESKLKLLHFENGVWINVTTSLDTVNDIICGVANSLSPFAVFEENEAPVIIAVTGPTGPLALGASPTVSVSFTDADADDTHSVRFSWDDGSAPTTVAATGGTAAATHTFAAAGVYTVTVTVRDNNDGTVTGTFEYVVIYDPSGGYVTGGGWIQSPAGAYLADSALTGKATFGFNSKYQPGANLPTGSTEFKLHFATLTFRSTIYEWLVVAGPQAQYKGTGTINGSGNYGFLLTGRDGQASGGGGTDKFRIKIWDLNQPGNPVVYDNARGSSDDIEQANPQILGGGSIVIHR